MKMQLLRTATLAGFLFAGAAVAAKSERQNVAPCSYFKREILPGSERHLLEVSVHGASCRDAELSVRVVHSGETLFSYRTALADITFRPSDETEARLVAQQAFESTEFSVVDRYPQKGSAFVNPEVLVELEANDPKVIVYFQDSPMGMSYAAYNQASGRWVRYLNVELP